MKNLLHQLPLYLLLALVSGCGTTYQPTRSASTPVAVNSAIAPDTAVLRIIQPYKQDLDKKMGEVIGFAPDELVKKEWESTLGNFVVDLMREQAQLQTKEAVDLAVTTNGGLRNPIPKGNVTIGNVYELMPFENELVVVRVPGSKLQQMFDLAAAKRTVPMANVTYNVQGSRPFDIKIGGQPLDPARTYTVAVSDYLANGGDNFIFFKGEKQLILGITVRDAILRQIRTLTATGKPITARIEGRVRGLD